MEKDKIIYKSKLKLFSPFGLILILLIGASFVYTSNSLTIKLFMGAVFGVSIIAAIINNYFATTILIKENKITLTKKGLLRKSTKESIDYTAIKSLKWNHGGHKQMRAIYLKTNKKPTIKIPISEGLFEFGYVLKFLHNKGVPINLVHSDHELQLYIEGKIENFPMTNEPETSTKKEN